MLVLPTLRSPVPFLFRMLKMHTVGVVAMTYTAGLPDLSLFLGYISLFRFMVLPSYFIDPIFIAIKKENTPIRVYFLNT